MVEPPWWQTPIALAEEYIHTIIDVYCDIIMYCIVFYFFKIVLYHITSYYIMLHHVTSHYIILYHIISDLLYHIIIYYNIL